MSINNLDNKNQPIINVFIFHDGENCFIPNKEIVRDKNNRMLFTGTNTKFNNKNIDYTAELIKQNVVKECFDILKNNEYNRNIPFCNYPGINLNNIDFRKVNILYYFVLQRFNNKKSNYYPSIKTSDSLSNSLFNINAHTKGVDLKINDLVDATVKVINRSIPSLFIIISGDGDFRNSIQTAYQAGCECCVLYNSDTRLTDNFDAFIKDCGFSRNSWWNVLEKCSVNSYAKVLTNDSNQIINNESKKNKSQKEEVKKEELKKEELKKEELKKEELKKEEVNKVEVNKVEPKKVEPKKVEPKKVEVKKEEVKKEEVKKEEPKKEEPKKEEPKKEEPKKEEPKKVEVKKEEVKKEEKKKVDLKKVEVKKEDPNKIDIKKEEQKKVEVKKEESKKVDVKKEESKKVDVKKEEPKKVDVKKEEQKKVEIKKEEPKKVDVKKEEQKKVDVKKAESNKDESKKADVKK